MDIRVREILEIVEKLTGANPLENLDRKKGEIILPRQLAMYAILEHTEHSQEYVGNLFNKDHATARHAHKVIKNRIDTEKGFLQEYADIIYYRSTVVYEPGYEPLLYIQEIVICHECQGQGYRDKESCLEACKICGGCGRLEKVTYTRRIKPIINNRTKNETNVKCN